MHESGVNFAIAVVGGILSFLSPCVLPLVPGYISYITGMSLEELTASDSRHFYMKVLYNSVAFVVGFSIVFIALGAGATSISRFLIRHMKLFSTLAGIIIFIFGLHLAGVITIPFLLRERRVQYSSVGAGLAGSFLIGFFFAFGWTPCVGPILAAILAMAAQEESMWKGIWLLSAYSAGLGIPFIFSALFINSFFTFFEGIKKHLRKIEIASGVLLMLVGVLMFLDKMSFLAQLFSKFIGFRG